MPHHPPTGEELAKIIEQITDRATLDKVESLISEKALSNLVDQLNDARGDAFKNDKGCPQAHLFLQRLLYRMNRLKLFWYDELENYVNENSR